MVIELLATAGPWAFKGAMGILWTWGGVWTHDWYAYRKYRQPISEILKNSAGVKRYSFLSGHGDTVYFSVSHGLLDKDIETLTEKIKKALGSHIEANLYKGMLRVKVYPKDLPKKLDYPGEEIFEGHYHCIWPVGKNHKDEWVILDLAKGPHLLIGGITGKGKSTEINHALYTNIVHHKAEVSRYLIDFKYGIEGQKFIGAGKYITIAEEVPDAIKITNGMIKEMQKRANLLKACEVEKWQDIPKHKRPPYILLIIDEFAEVSPDLDVKENRKPKELLMQNIMFLLQKGRAVGISLVICTQRPDKDVVPGILKTNIPWTIALHVRNEVNSRILLDNDKAVGLKYPGRCIVQTHDEEIVCQIPILTSEEIRKRLSIYQPPAPTDSASTDIEIPKQLTID